MKDVYLIGGPAAGKIVRLPDDQKSITVQYVKSESEEELIYAECKYAPKHKGDFLAHEFHWMGDY